MCVHIKLHKFRTRTKVLEFVENYNNSLPPTASGRRPLGKMLRQQHVHLIEHLVELYYLEIKKARYHGQAPELGDTLPSFRTNNAQLAYRLNCSERTIRGLRKRLKAAGVIEAEHWHGTNSSYEIWLNPDLLHMTTPETDHLNIASQFARPACSRPEFLQKKPAGLLSAQMKTLPHTVSSKPLLVTTSLNKLSGADSQPAVENQAVTPPDGVEKPQKAGENAGKPVDNQQMSNDGLHKTGYRTGMRNSGNNAPPVAAAPPQKAPETLAEVLAGLPERQALNLDRITQTLYRTAVTTLYRDWWIADAEAERTRARLAEYLRYAPVEKWKAGATEVMERMALVRKWIERNHGDGYRMNLPSRYFDVRNETKAAFVRTKKWFKDHKAAQREIHNRVLLTKAVREYLASLEPGADVGPAETYRRISQRLNKRDRSLLELFHQQIDQHEPAAA